jgi:hypothetical protein
LKTGIAYGVLYLASDESKFLTGEESLIDGGFTTQSRLALKENLRRGVG